MADLATQPFNPIVFVCTHKRDDGSRPSCGLRGSEALCDALKAEMKRRGLKGKARVSKSGCMDLCEQGPNVMAFPQNTLWSHVQPGDIPTLSDKLFK